MISSPPPTRSSTPQNSETSRPRLRHPRIRDFNVKRPSACARVLAAAMPELCKKLSLEHTKTQGSRVLRAHPQRVCKVVSPR
jgi:hypothetical protein